MVTCEAAHVSYREIQCLARVYMNQMDYPYLLEIAGEGIN